jgi:CxxC-x17-CxxC domain-containing protein
MIKNKRPNSFGAKKPFGDRSSSYGGGSSAGGDRNYGGRNERSYDRPSSRYEGGEDRPSRPLHKATCSKCGVACEVPFKPRDPNGVLCNGCFKRGNGPNKPERSERPDRFDRPERSDRFERSERPARFDRDERPARFEYNEKPERRTAEAPKVDAGAADIKRQLAEINTKLDAILLSLESVFEDEEE